jgi:hypothetical protein
MLSNRRMARIATSCRNGELVIGLLSDAARCGWVRHCGLRIQLFDLADKYTKSARSTRILQSDDMGKNNHGRATDFIHVPRMHNQNLCARRRYRQYLERSYIVANQESFKLHDCILL